MTLSNFNQDDSSVATEPTFFHWNGQENQVSVSGSFQLNGVDDWTPIAMERFEQQNQFIIALNLKPGVYQYKFVVDGHWTCDFQSNTTTDSSGNINNTITVLDALAAPVNDGSASKTSSVATMIVSDSIDEAVSPLSPIISDLKPKQGDAVFISESQTLVSPEIQSTTSINHCDVDPEDNTDNAKSSSSPTTLAPELVDSTMPSLTNSNSPKSHQNPLDSHTLDCELHDPISPLPIHDNLLRLELVEENQNGQQISKNDSSGFQNKPLSDKNTQSTFNSNNEKEIEKNSIIANVESQSSNNQNILESEDQENLEDYVVLENDILTDVLSVPGEEPKCTDDTSDLIEPPSSDIYGQETHMAIDEICQLYNKEEILVEGDKDSIQNKDEAKTNQLFLSEPLDLNSVNSNGLKTNNWKSKKTSDESENESTKSLVASDTNQKDRSDMPLDNSQYTTIKHDESHLESKSCSTTLDTLDTETALLEHLVSNNSVESSEKNTISETSCPQDNIDAAYDESNNSDFLVDLHQSSSESLDDVVKKIGNLLTSSTEETVLGSDDSKFKSTTHLVELKSTSSSNTVALDDEFIHQKDDYITDKVTGVPSEDQISQKKAHSKFSLSSDTKESEAILATSRSTEDDSNSELEIFHLNKNTSSTKSLENNSSNSELTKGNSDVAKPYNALLVASKYLVFGVFALLAKFYRTFTWGMFFKVKDDGPKPDTKDDQPKDNVASSLKTHL